MRPFSTLHTTDDGCAIVALINTSAYVESGRVPLMVQLLLLETFSNRKVLLLSYFYDHIDPLLPPPSASRADSSASPSSLRPLKVPSLAADVCLGRTSWENRWAGHQVAMEVFADRPGYCLNLTYMHALFRPWAPPSPWSVQS